MPSPQFLQFYQTLKASIPLGELTLQETRARFEQLMSPYLADPGVTFEPLSFAHCSGAWIKASNVSTAKALLFFHGGGYTVGSWQSHQQMLGRISKYGRVPICAVDYRLAPEHPFPAAVEDALNSYETLLRQGWNPEQIIVGGSSAGGGLALALFLKLKRLKKPLPRAAILICPWVDLALTGKSLTANDGKDFIRRFRLVEAIDAYLGSHNPKDPLVSPLYADFKGFPPLLIQAGTIEILWSEIESLSQKALKSGVQVTFEPYEEMFHTWQLFPSKVPEGDQALRSIGHYIKSL